MMSFLALEPALVARLTERLPATVRVLTAADLASVAEGSQPTPAVHVVLRGYTVAESRPDGRAARLRIPLLMVVAVRNAQAVRTGSGARESADPIIDAVMGALMGFKPSMVSAPLALTDAPTGGFSAGFSYTPISFSTEMVVQGGD